MMSDKRETEDPKAGTTATESEDFQFGLRALLAAYQPVLEQQLNLIANPQELQRQVQTSRQTCAEEFAEAYALFEKFFTEDVAQRLLPAQGRELLGPIDQWRWCFLHIRCCLVLGWLVCRWPRTFRGFAYYLYEYWRCVRQIIGNPVSDPPTAEQRRDFETLVKVLAEAFKPYLSDQLASVEFPAGVPDEVIAGAIDCFTDEQDACAIFERLLTTEAARALFGEAAFKEYSQQQSFWLCRCWCLCSICFGCCLARARNIQQIVRCYESYLRCLVDCFKPLTCAITQPAAGDCAVEQYYIGPKVYGIEIVGTATGAFCDHYILEWKDPLAPPGAYTQAFCRLCTAGTARWAGRLRHLRCHAGLPSNLRHSCAHRCRGPAHGLQLSSRGRRRASSRCRFKSLRRVSPLRTSKEFRSNHPQAGPILTLSLSTPRSTR